MVEGAAGDEDRAVVGESTVPKAMLPFLMSTPPGPTSKLFCLEWAFLIEMAAEFDTSVIFEGPDPS